MESNLHLGDPDRASYYLLVAENPLICNYKALRAFGDNSRGLARILILAISAPLFQDAEYVCISGASFPLFEYVYIVL